ncbi:hypothetical protein ACFWZK_06540 [[Kitasatospora] papulosa]|uniref:hypothetical protein n=1 Tax=[Kitasatospora] papulosa TaxID=1464011 RepID=UPI00368E8A69
MSEGRYKTESVSPRLEPPPWPAPSACLQPPGARRQRFCRPPLPARRRRPEAADRSSSAAPFKVALIRNSPEPIITLRHIDLPLQIDLLRELGADFTALHTKLTALDPEPGSDLLRQVGPQILAIHDLVSRSLVRLSVLDGSQYTAVPGSRLSLDTLSGVTASASIAASQLARAVGDNPLDGADFAGGPPADEESVRQARHTEAAPVLAKSLTTAAQHLELSATCCQYTASAIIRDLTEHPEHRPDLPELSPAQYAVLERIAQGGTRRYAPHNRPVRVTDGDGQSIHAKPFGVLEKERLIRVARTSRYVSQDVVVTAAGQLALDFQKPHRSQAPSPAKPPAPRNTGGRTR